MTEISLETSIDDISVKKQTKAGYIPVTLATPRGNVVCRYYHTAGVRKAVIFIGDNKGGFDSPASNLYPKLCKELQKNSVSALRIKFRYPTDLVESVLDAVVGITFLERFGIEEIALVGHAFGGAVVIQAAAAAPETVTTVVTLATQAYGAEAATYLENISLLLIHGANDEILPPHTSTYVHDMAPGKKQLHVYEGATHGLHEVARPIRKEIHAWLLAHFR
jgi:fermentation-respiration switch protein FrsA (DUF1100 family)